MTVPSQRPGEQPLVAKRRTPGYAPSVVAEKQPLHG